MPVQLEILVFTSYSAVMVWLHFHNYNPRNYYDQNLILFID